MTDTRTISQLEAEGYPVDRMRMLQGDGLGAVQDDPAEDTDSEIPSRVSLRLPHLSAHNVSKIDHEVRAALTELGKPDEVRPDG